MATPWEVLGVREGATAAELRAAYRQACLRLHPDRVDPWLRSAAHDAMAEVNTAYQVLLAAGRGWEPPSAAVTPYRPRNRWDRELAPEPARGVSTDTAA